MQFTTLGKTGLKVSRTSFGCLPIQRIPADAAVALLRMAFDGGVNFFDTARYYNDSEEKIGMAFEGMRDKIIIATKSPALDGETLRQEIEVSLKALRTDYIDLLQFHVAKKCHRPGEPDGLYDAAVEAKKAGLIRHIGLTSHRLDVAMESAKSGLFDTIQFPFSYLSSDGDIELVKTCRDLDIGFIAMKALSGGLITNARMAFAFMRQYDNVVPIWGVQKMVELEEFLSLEQNPPPLDDAMRKSIEDDKRELSGNFCRGCGYCLPCPAGIELNWASRMSQAIRRMKDDDFFTEEWQAKMERVKDCIHCGACKKRCPYELDPEILIQTSYKDYWEYYAEWKKSK